MRDVELEGIHVEPGGVRNVWSVGFPAEPRLGGVTFGKIEGGAGDGAVVMGVHWKDGSIGTLALIPPPAALSLIAELFALYDWKSGDEVQHPDGRLFRINHVEKEENGGS